MFSCCQASSKSSEYRQSQMVSIFSPGLVKLRMESMNNLLLKCQSLVINRCALLQYSHTRGVWELKFSDNLGVNAKCHGINSMFSVMCWPQRIQFFFPLLRKDGLWCGSMMGGKYWNSSLNTRNNWRPASWLVWDYYWGIENRKSALRLWPGNGALPWRTKIRFVSFGSDFQVCEPLV